MNAIYKPESIENEVTKKFNLSDGAYGDCEAGIVICEDGFRLYVMKDGEEQAELGCNTLEEAISKIDEIVKATGSTIIEVK